MLTPTTGVTLADYNAAILDGNQTHARVVFPVQNITLTGANICANGGLKITDLMNPDDDLKFGKAVSKEVTMYLLNGDIFNGFDWTEEFRIDLGVDINDATKWVTIGYFKGKKPARIKRTEIIEFTSLDRMQLFKDVADDFLDTLTYPITLGDIYHELCSYIGIGYTAGNEIADAMSVQYTECPFDRGITNRALLAYIAEANGCYAVITADGNVKLKWFNDQTSNYSISGQDYFNLIIGEEDVPAVDAVRIGSTDPEESGFTYPVNNFSNAYEIINNPLLLNMNTTEKTAVITAMLTRFSALGTYKEATVPVVGNWMIETGDIIEVVYDDNNETVDMPVFARELVWNGGCTDIYQCTGQSERDDVTETVAEEYKQDGKYYIMRSGIDITDDGIDIVGNKYLKLRSGGVVDIQSQNFVVDSANQLFQADGWKMYAGGISGRKVESSKNIDFNFGKNTGASDAYMTGFINFIAPTSGNNRVPTLQFGAIDNSGNAQNIGVELTKIAGIIPVLRAMSGYNLNIGDSTRPINSINTQRLYGNCLNYLGQVVSLGTVNDGNLDIPFSGTVNCLICVFSNSSNRMRICLCRGRNNATPIYIDLGGGSDIVFSTTSSNKLRVKNNAAYDAFVYGLIITGSIDDIG